jgi:DNA-binding CsgD family transcriptional regulator
MSAVSLGSAPAFVGRTHELNMLLDAAQRARGGHGCLVLIAGDAGAGKTRLAREAIAAGALRSLEAGSLPRGASPFAPLAAALRSAIRKGWLGAGQLGPHISLLLPELGAPPNEIEPEDLAREVLSALAAVADQAPVAILLDDLQWSDSATLELLPALASEAVSRPLLLIGTYRDVGLPRLHPLRSTRTDLRRHGRLNEISLGGLSPTECATLATAVLGRPPDDVLLADLVARSSGLPYFVEELAAALCREPSDSSVLLPETIRDAVRLRVAQLSPDAQQLLTVAAVMGFTFEMDIVATLSDSPAAVDEVLDSGLIVEQAGGDAAFRHALVQECMYQDIGRSERRALHRRLAERLELAGGSSVLVAQHWFEARELEAARVSFLRAAEDASAYHAYRDAMSSARRALSLWPSDVDVSNRLSLLGRLADCAAATGDMPAAAAAWNECAAGYRDRSDWQQLAVTERNLAALYELEGDGAAALAARLAAQDAFKAANAPEEAAVEKLAAVTRLEKMGRYAEALRELDGLTDLAKEADRSDIRARHKVLEGQLRADRGEMDAGIDLIRQGLNVALEANLVEESADAYYRLAVTMMLATDYDATRNAYEDAISFCHTNDAPVMQLVCLGCLTVVLRQTGEWDRGIALCREVRASANAPTVVKVIAAGLLGSFQTLRGELARTRPLLTESYERSLQIGIASMVMDSAWNLAMLDQLEGLTEAAEARFRFILEHWTRTEDRHYVVAPLVGAATFFARAGMESEAGACARSLAGIAADTGNAEALAGAAVALAESALLGDDVPGAVRHFDRALRLLEPLEVPYDRARIELRAGSARAAMGDRPAALDLLSSSYRVAQKLGARPLAAEAARAIGTLGEPLSKRLGKRATRFLDRGGLSRRELEVLRLVCQGQTTRAIAETLILSPRTVEMYVGNVLSKLDCSTRAEAAARAHELGLVVTDANRAPV